MEEIRGVLGCVHGSGKDDMKLALNDLGDEMRAWTERICEQGMSWEIRGMRLAVGI